MDWGIVNRNPANICILKSVSYLQSPFFAVWTQTGLKAAVISAFSSGEWDRFLKESAKYKALTNSQTDSNTRCGEEDDFIIRLRKKKLVTK